jgi:hypothetical protein
VVKYFHPVCFPFCLGTNNISYLESSLNKNKQLIKYSTIGKIGCRIIIHIVTIQHHRCNMKLNGALLYNNYYSTLTISNKLYIKVLRHCIKPKSFGSIHVFMKVLFMLRQSQAQYITENLKHAVCIYFLKSIVH